VFVPSQAFSACRLCYKTFRTRNLRQKDIFCIKLVCFMLSVTHTLAWTNTPSYCQIRILRIDNVLKVTPPERRTFYYNLQKSNYECLSPHPPPQTSHFSHRANVIKLFTAVSYAFHNKPECFSLASLIQPSLISVSKAVVYLSEALHSRVGSWPYPQTLDWAGKASQGQTL
jgi:hypothetical protein